MKILSLHCDYLKFKPLKKALKQPEELKSTDLIEIKEPLGIFIAVEKTDEGELKKVVNGLIANILDLKQKVNAKNIVLYPYAHLSSNLSNPDFALEVLKEAEKQLNKKKIKTHRAPFGYYKEFELKCKGHPLAELSREISINKEKTEDGFIKIMANKQTDKQGDKQIRQIDRQTGKEEIYDYKKLLKQISETKLDTSKLKENDHRILGQQLNLFSFNETAPGMVFWHNKGWIIYKELIEFLRQEQQKAGYEEISTPQILDKKLWQISGHWEKYKENIFLTKYEDRDFAVKPMNCPGGLLVFKSTPKSYKDFPLRTAELGTVHRQELSGVLAGLFRVIKFTQDDAHIFCTNEKQLEKEVANVIDLVGKIYKPFGLKYHIELSTRPKKRIGSKEIWDKAEKALENVLKKKKIKFKLNKGDGAFYGPKIDFHIKDSLGRTWQCATIQADFAMPERFGLEYTDKDNKRKTPIMIHHAVYGAIERFIGILLEHLNGNLPLWIAPIQVRVLSFTDRNKKSAEKILNQLKQEGIRADGDFHSTTMGEKVRDAEMQKIPYIITIGDKEQKSKSVAVRERSKKALKQEKVDKLISRLKKQIKEKK